MVNMDILTFFFSFLERLNFFHSKNTFISFVFFCIGLLIKPRKCNLSTISKICFYPYQRLQYFLSESNWDFSKIREEKQKIAQDFKSDFFLIIDDTSERKWNSLKKQYCGSMGKVEKCQVLVVGSLCVAGTLIRLPVFIYPYDGTFSKIEIAKKIILEAILIFNISFVMFDCWYAEEELIKLVDSNGIKFLCKIKSSRIVNFGCSRKKVAGLVTTCGGLTEALKFCIPYGRMFLDNI